MHAAITPSLETQYMLEEKANTDTFYVHIFIYTDKGLGETFNIMFLFDCSAMKIDNSSMLLLNLLAK